MHDLSTGQMHRTCVKQDKEPIARSFTGWLGEVLMVGKRWQMIDIHVYDVAPGAPPSFGMRRARRE